MAFVSSDRYMKSQGLPAIGSLVQWIGDFQRLAQCPLKPDFHRLRRVMVVYCVVVRPEIDKRSTIAELQCPLAIRRFGSLLEQ